MIEVVLHNLLKEEYIIKICDEKITRILLNFLVKLEHIHVKGVSKIKTKVTIKKFVITSENFARLLNTKEKMLNFVAMFVRFCITPPR